MESKKRRYDGEEDNREESRKKALSVGMLVLDSEKYNATFLSVEDRIFLWRWIVISCKTVLHSRDQPPF